MRLWSHWSPSFFKLMLWTQRQVIATTNPQEPRANNSLSTDLPRTLGLCPAQQLEVLSQSANLVSFLPLMPSSRVGVGVFLSCVFGCLHFPDGFAFWPSSGFFTTTDLIHLFPIFSLHTFVQRLAEGIPVSLNQGRTPSSLFNVVDIYQSLRCLHLFSSQRQLV